MVYREKEASFSPCYRLILIRPHIFFFVIKEYTNENSEIKIRFESSYR